MSSAPTATFSTRGSRAVPALPGATSTRATRSLCASFQASACSRPPPPTTSTVSGPLDDGADSGAGRGAHVGTTPRPDAALVLHGRDAVHVGPPPAPSVHGPGAPLPGTPPAGFYRPPPQIRSLARRCGSFRSTEGADCKCRISSPRPRFVGCSRIDIEPHINRTKAPTTMSVDRSFYRCMRRWGVEEYFLKAEAHAAREAD